MAFMAQISRIFPRPDGLNTRRVITVELPEFAIRALHYRADVANIGSATDEDTVSFNDVIEWYVLSPLSVKEMPHLEEAVPGFTAAFTRWLFESTYQPPE
jgi:hypothetical protein